MPELTLRFRSLRSPVLAASVLLSICLGGAALPSGAAEPPFTMRLEEVRALLEEEGRRQEAERQAQALLLEAETFGRSSLGAAAALDLLVNARYLNNKRREEETLKLAWRAVELRRELQGNEHPEFATSLHQLADVLHSNLRYQEALDLFDQSLAIRESLFGRDSPEVAESLDDLGDLYDDIGDKQRAREILERSLDIRERHLGPDHRDVGQSLNTLANVLYRMGHYDQAKARWQRAFEIYQAELPPGHPLVARALHNLGAVHHVLGEVAQAFVFYRRALEINRQVYGELNALTGGTHTALAMLLQDAGHFAEAGTHYRQALAGLEEALRKDHPRYARALSNLGELYRESGDYEAARRLLEDALHTRRRALGPDHPDVGMSLTALGSLLFDMGEADRARETLLEALRIHQQDGRDHPLVAETLRGLARLEEAAGRFEAARRYLERALELRKRQGESHPHVAEPLADLARLQAATGAPRNALGLLDQGLAAVTASFGDGHPQVAHLLAGRARILVAMQRDEEAMETGLRAAKVGREHVLLTVRSLAERQALAYATSMNDSLDLALSLLASGQLSGQGIEAAVWDAVIRSRALVLDEVSARHRLAGASQDPELRDLAEAFLGARERLANLMVRVGSQPLEPRLATPLEEARRAAVDTERALAEHSRKLRRDLERRAIGFAEVAASLPPDSALLAVVLFEQILPGREADAGARYLAFVLRPAGSPVAVALGPAEPLDAQVRELRHAVGRGASGSVDDEAAYRTIAGRLREQVWDPLAPYLSGIRTVFFVPDGSLNLVNPSAFPIGGEDYVIDDGPRIHLLTAERDLVRHETAMPSGGTGLLAVGAVDFDDRGQFAALRAPSAESQRPWQSKLASFKELFEAVRLRDGCTTLGSHFFLPLPATTDEIAEVGALWQKVSAEPVVQLARKTATEAELKHLASGRRVLHFATHGFFLGGQCTPAGGPLSRSLAVPAGARDAITLSGLALAGANHRHKAWVGEQDGILTAEEIAALDLSGVEWAVLSACDTGIGEIRAGEGVFGLRRAFEIAGARTVIMSLWPVEDRSARQWMLALYESRLALGLSTVEAVHNASVKMLQTRRRSGDSTHPFFWASFVAAGDWR